MALPRKARTGGLYDDFMVNVFDISSKKIVFTGNIQDAADFIGIQRSAAMFYLKTKYRCRKKFALRNAKN